MDWRSAPVGAPGDGGHEAHVGEQDGAVLDAVQGVVHLAQRQSIQLELQLHLQKPMERHQVVSQSVAKSTWWDPGRTRWTTQPAEWTSHSLA